MNNAFLTRGRKTETVTESCDENELTKGRRNTEEETPKVCLNVI